MDISDEGATEAVSALVTSGEAGEAVSAPCGSLSNSSDPESPFGSEGWFLASRFESATPSSTELYIGSEPNASVAPAQCVGRVWYGTSMWEHIAH